MATRVEPSSGIIIVKAATASAGLVHSGPQTVDTSVSLVAGDIVLDKDNATGALQGLWLVQAGAWIMVDPGISDGLLIEVLQGTVNANKTFRVTSVSVWGTDTPTFQDQTGGSAGGMVTLTGSQVLTNKTLSTGNVISAAPSFAKETDYSLAVAATTTAATVGGALGFVAGAGATSGAGGAASLTGGLAGATGIGGAASLVAGAGGATSGAGGAAAVTGGAGTAGNALGGAATVTGGAGQGSSAGGVGSLIGGVGGATGAGGAVSLTGGAGGATSGTGGAVAITGGAGSAGNANGGAVTINGGAPNGSGTRGTLTLQSAVATPAAGSAAASVRLGTTAGLGLYYGSNAPTVSAAQGSLYIRSDGSSTSTRLYVNTDGGTTWTNVTTAA